jgi:ferritin-like metal-binding protein YciE
MAANTLAEVYASELQDLLSANDQMTKAVKMMSGKANDPQLKKTLEKSVSGITQHAETLKGLLKEIDPDLRKDHCKGMEGLVQEATKHVGAEAPGNPELLDVEIISQYQRMSHYGIAGFGTAAAYAKALQKKDHLAKLEQIVGDIYQGDEYASKLAERVEAAAAKAA